MGLYCDGSYVYYAARMSQSDAKGYLIPSTNDWFYEEFKEFYALLSGGAQTIAYDEFVAPVFIMNAIVRALESGKREIVGRAQL